MQDKVIHWESIDHVPTYLLWLKTRITLLSKRSLQIFSGYVVKFKIIFKYL